LPTPDPKALKEKAKDFYARQTANFKGKQQPDYQAGFDKPPESLNEDDDADDDDLAGPMNGKRSKSNLNFDSDEEKDGSELITLDKDEVNRDRVSTAADKIPKLNKPQTQ